MTAIDGSYIVEGEYLVTVERLKVEDPRRAQSANDVEKLDDGKKKRKKKSKKRNRSSSSSSSCSSTSSNAKEGKFGVDLSGTDGDKRNILKREKPDQPGFFGKLRNSFKSKDKPKVNNEVPIEGSGGINFKFQHADGSGEEGKISAERIPSPDVQIRVRTLSRSMGDDGNSTADEWNDLELDVPAGKVGLTAAGCDVRAKSPDCDVTGGAGPPSPTLSECGAQLDDILDSIASGEFLGRAAMSPKVPKKIGIRGEGDGDVDLDMDINLTSRGFASGHDHSKSSSSSKGSRKGLNLNPFGGSGSVGVNDLTENSKPQVTRVEICTVLDWKNAPPPLNSLATYLPNHSQWPPPTTHCHYPSSHVMTLITFC